VAVGRGVAVQVGVTEGDASGGASVPVKAFSFAVHPINRSTITAVQPAIRFVGFFCQCGPILVDGDTAEARVWTHEILEAEDGTTSRPLGRYDDRYVRTADGWRLQRRVFSLRRG